MAAGLAHELNNPAAAAQRAAAQTGGGARRVSLDRRHASSSRASSARRPSELVALQREALAARPRRTALDALDARRRRGRAARPRSRSCGVPEPWRLAEPLAAAGRRRGLARPESPRSAGPATDAAVAWVAATLDRARSGRGAAASPPSACRQLVGAVKSYAYMDRGDLVEVDLHEGIETTLTVLGHKLKHTRDRGRARLRPRAAAADGARLGAEPGLDEPARQRDRRARRGRARSRSRTRRDGDGVLRRRRRRRPGHPAGDPRPHLRSVLHHQGRGPGHRASASRPPAGSSSTATAAR